MNVLIVFTHPKRECFNRKLLNAVISGLEAAGHEYQVADLYAENFQPAMIEEDFAQFDRKPMPPEILAEQKRVEWSDAVIFIFPLWWWSVPAMLKGWIDRVVSYGWAWENPLDPSSGYLDERKILVLISAGASLAHLAKRDYDKALDIQLNTGTWDYCGFRDVTTHIFESVHEESPNSLFEQYFSEAEEMARNLFPRGSNERQ
jgi:NAD(P)H dehydrogenase (quinone)